MHTLTRVQRVPISINVLKNLRYPFLSWSIVNLQCCVSFRYTAKWFCYTYTHLSISIIFQILSPKKIHWHFHDKTQSPSVQFSSVTQSCPTLCNPMNCITPGHPVHHQLLEFTQTQVHRVGDAIQPSHPLWSPSPPAPQSLPASESFPMSQLFTWGGQSTGVSGRSKNIR